jgi:hypothetical protein
MNLPPLLIILLLLPFVAIKLASSSGGTNGDGASSSSSIVASTIGGGQHCQWNGKMSKRAFSADYNTFGQRKFNLLVSEKPIGEGTYGKVGERTESALLQLGKFNFVKNSKKKNAWPVSTYTS